MYFYVVLVIIFFVNIYYRQMLIQFMESSDTRILYEISRCRMYIQKECPTENISQTLFPLM